MLSGSPRRLREPSPRPCADGLDSVNGDEAHEYGHTAIADTPSEALWAASPLHPYDAPYPGDEPLDAELQALRLTRASEDAT